MSTQKTVVIESTNYSYPYKKITVPCTIWSSRESNGSIETIIFLGTVQIEKLAEWVAESCPPNTIVIQGAPHWLANSDGSDIPEYTFNFTKCAFDAVLKDFPVANVHIIAESQAVPGVLELLGHKKYALYARTITLLQPLGLNIDAYSGTEKQRVDVFRRRIATNFLYQLTALTHDRRLRYNHRLANKLVGITMRNPKARAQYSSGLMHDAAPALKRLYGFHQDIRIICGANDKIFPASEIIATLAKNGMGIEVQAVKGVPHSPLATRYGQKLLAAALNR
jgi:hypothetical protein